MTKKPQPDRVASDLAAHEVQAVRRERALAEREELVRLREVALDARREADEARAERERTLVQLREANEMLVMAIVQADELADEANAARVAADHNEERFRSLVTTSSAIVWQATADGRVQVDREGWSRFTGLDAGPDEWGWLAAVHPDDRDRVGEAWTTAVATACPYTCQHRIRRRDGGYAWVAARAVPIPRSGPVREWIGMMGDVSDRVRVEEARERFIGILGHDLRNPLSAILTGCELLGDVPEPGAKVIGRITRAAHRMESMIRDVLDFALGRLGKGIPIAPIGSDLRAICDEVVEEMRQAYPGRTMTFEAIGDLRGEWDPDRLAQVVSNLLGNAVSHGADPIGVTLRDEGAEVVMIVHNDGPPIPEAAIPSLFEPFSQVAPTAGKPAQGLGLGLYIVSEIVQAHGGTIIVSSVEGEGTTFVLRWPRHGRVPRRRPTTRP